jgi:peroxiredoxin
VLRLPPYLPIPADDGAAAHLLGQTLPAIALPSTTGEAVRLDERSASRRVVLFAYPRTGRPDQEPPPGWNEIPGARGCTPENCAFRDLHGELQAAGAEVFGLSTQSSEYQREMAERLHLPFPILSDELLELSHALSLPTFRLGDDILLRRVTMILRDGKIEHVFYPVFPPDHNAAAVLAWLKQHPIEPWV